MSDNYSNRLKPNKRLFKFPKYKKGVLFDENKGCIFLFFDLKDICKKLDLPYKPLSNSARTQRYYMGRYWVKYVNVPHETINF